MQQQQQSSTVVVGAPQPAPYYVQPQSRPPVTNFRDQQALMLGIAQILIGVLCIIFNAVALGIHELLSVAAHGIWGGVIVSMPVHRLDDNNQYNFFHLNQINNLCRKQPYRHRLYCQIISFYNCHHMDKHYETLLKLPTKISVHHHRKFGRWRCQKQVKMFGRHYQI